MSSDIAILNLKGEKKGGIMLGKLFGKKRTVFSVSAVVRIYDEDEVPDMEGFEEMPYCAIDAYPSDHFLSEAAKEIAVRTVASYFKITEQEALDQFEICVVPSTLEFHGKIMAKRK
jgi:hypothetical protein